VFFYLFAICCVKGGPQAGGNKGAIDKGICEVGELVLSRVFVKRGL